MSAAAQSRDVCLPDVILGLGRAQDAVELVELFSRYLEEISLGPFVLAEVRCASTDWQKNLILGTVSEKYLEEYFATRSLFDSPIFRTAQYTCEPTSLAKVYDQQLLSRRGYKIYQRARKFGLQDGYCFPLKGRDCRPTLMLIAGDFTPVDARAIMVMEMVVLAFYRRACALFPETKLASKRQKGGLSDRERETLSWVAQGKTDWETAQLLEISERTVHYHIENAKKKMKVSTRLQAVVEAIRTLEILL